MEKETSTMNLLMSIKPYMGMSAVLKSGDKLFVSKKSSNIEKGMVEREE